MLHVKSVWCPYICGQWSQDSKAALAIPAVCRKIFFIKEKYHKLSAHRRLWQIKVVYSPIPRPCKPSSHIVGISLPRTVYQ